LVFKPDSRATLRKVTPRSVVDCGETAACERKAGIHFLGSARARTLSSGSTSAERLSDWRNARRVEAKRYGTFPAEPRARIRRSLIIRPTRLCKHAAQRGPLECTSRRELLIILARKLDGDGFGDLLPGPRPLPSLDSALPSEGASRPRKNRTSWSFRGPSGRGNFCP
jgi:hypothetical protein